MIDFKINNILVKNNFNYDKNILISDQKIYTHSNLNIFIKCILSEKKLELWNDKNLIAIFSYNEFFEYWLYHERQWKPCEMKTWKNKLISVIDNIVCN